MNKSCTTAFAGLKAIIALVLVVMMTATGTHAFAPIGAATSKATPRRIPNTRHQMSWSEVNDFYQLYPIQSAVVTCGFKASLADGIAQFTSTTNKQWEVKRNLSYILYGGIFVGCMCHAEYHILFPLLFGTETPHVMEKVLLDNFVSAPLMWLPPAYLIKAFMYDETWQEGLTKYWKDITEQGLLLKYWTIWLPAQTVSFSYVPDHLRVAFMAMISFFWFILFSSVASSSSDASPTIGAMVEEEMASRIPLITNK